jgi:phosphate-selective porin OprO and OprP
VDRSIVVEAFKPTYDIGAMLHGKVANGLAYYYAGVYGGAGQTSTRSTNDNMFVARAVVNPLGDMAYSESDMDGSVKPLLSIGANYFMNTLNKSAGGATATLDNTNANYAATVSTTSTAALGNGGWLGRGFRKAGFAAAGIDKIDVDSYGADLAFKWMGFSLQGEYLLAQAEANSSKHLLRAQGFYVQTGYMIIPHKLEAAFRYSYFDPDRDMINDHLIETVGAVSYYFDKHNLKLQGDIGNIHSQTSTKPTDDMQYRLQVQLIF